MDEVFAGAPNVDALVVAKAAFQLQVTLGGGHVAQLKRKHLDAVSVRLTQWLIIP